MKPLALLILLTLPVSLIAQAERHELGRKLRLFETTWESNKNRIDCAPAAKKMNAAVMSFFSLKFREAARAMDEGTMKLMGPSASRALPDLLSLWIQPEQRWLDTTTKTLKITVDRFYPMPDSKLREVDFCYYWISSQGQAIKLPTNTGKSAIPGTMTIDVPTQAGDYMLQIVWKTGDTTLTENYCTISLSDNQNTRWKKVKENIATWATPLETVDTISVNNLSRLLDRLQKAETLETDYPADRLLKECEAVCSAVANKTSYYSQQRSGQFWIGVKTASKGNVIMRIQPAKVEPGKKVPLVLALHGAGGSENLFFDGYGNGKVARLAAERGWFVVAPRSTITKPGHGDTIDELAKLYPEIDTSKVFVVGHSMGAGEAMREACANPKRFAAIAALGGGGGTKPAKGQEEAFQKLPIYVGVGEFDFALKQSEALAGNLQKAGVADIKFKKFPVLEHMIIVQDALPEVFQFFDGVMKR